MPVGKNAHKGNAVEPHNSTYNFTHDAQRDRVVHDHGHSPDIFRVQGDSDISKSGDWTRIFISGERTFSFIYGFCAVGRPEDRLRLQHSTVSLSGQSHACLAN